MINQLENLECPICKSNNIKYWFTKNNFDLYICKKCTHRFVGLEKSFLMPDDLDIYRERQTNFKWHEDQKVYDELVKGESPGEHVYRTTEIIKDLVKKFKFPEKRKWLDVGSGSGYLLKHIKRIGWDETGIEPGGWGSIAAKENDVNIIQCFLEKNTFKEKFHVVSMIDVLEHQADPDKFIQIGKYFLEDDGILIISIPFFDSFKAQVRRKKWNMIDTPTHCQFFTKKSLKIFLSNNGFAVNELVQFNYPFGIDIRLRKFISIPIIGKIIGGDQLTFTIKKIMP